MNHPPTSQIDWTSAAWPHVRDALNADPDIMDLLHEINRAAAEHGLMPESLAYLQARELTLLYGLTVNAKARKHLSDALWHKFRTEAGLEV